MTTGNNTPWGGPQIIVVGGPNGAGKTTTAARILPHGLGLDRFINADYIAKGLSPHNPDGAGIAAGRVMIARMRAMLAEGASFALESTLASRSLVPFLRRAQGLGFGIRMGYVITPSVELSMARVAQRVAKGGHDIPPDVIRRRYWRGLRNFETLYRPLSNAWTLYDNSGELVQPMASQRQHSEVEVYDEIAWARFREQAARAIRGMDGC